MYRWRVGDTYGTINLVSWVPSVWHTKKIYYYNFSVLAALAWFICFMEWIVIRSKTLAQGTKEEKQIGHGLDRGNGVQALIN